VISPAPPWLQSAFVALATLSGSVSSGCATGIALCPGASTTPSAPVVSSSVADPIDPIIVKDAGFVDKDTLVLIVRYRGGSEPHRFTLFMRQPWGVTDPGRESVLLQHETPRDAGDGERLCRLQFDFSGELGRAWAVFGDRSEAIPFERESRRQRHPGTPLY